MVQPRPVHYLITYSVDAEQRRPLMNITMPVNLRLD